MRALRKYLCWTFAFTSFVCFRITFLSIQKATHQLHALPSLRAMLVIAAFAVFGVVFATGWWTVLKEKASARAWGIAASLINTALPTLPVIFGHQSVNSGAGIVFFIGIIGLVAFVSRVKQQDHAGRNQANPSIPGDRTSRLINKMAGTYIFALSAGAYFWWIGWLKHVNLFAHLGHYRQFAMTLVVMLIISTTHEIGHAVVGMACGMKLQAFFAGPFQWRVRDGRWEFHFSPKGLLLAGGATGLVPATGNIQRWRYVCMMFAGPLVNLFTGVFALSIALNATYMSPLQFGGFLFLFGAWSLALAAGNLIPFRIKNSYSDGAILLQLLSHSPLAEYQLAVASIGSSLVTPLRPRDYDILTIQRAARNIPQGRQAMLLRLYSYSYSLDAGRIQEAGEALAEAESVYHQSVTDIPAEMDSVFVFGNAYVRHDAAAAREWWERLQAKKPTHRNAAYWRANCALHWIEGDLQRANAAWQNSNTLARQLPQAGAYEFERHCCSLLRSVLDEAPAAAA